MRIAVVIALAALAGCGPQPGEVPTGQNNALVVNSRDVLYVTRDRVNGVTCWSKNGTTLTCLPDWMLDNQSAVMFDREVR
jgi:hypothetical protein